MPTPAAAAVADPKSAAATPPKPAPKPAPKSPRVLKNVGRNTGHKSRILALFSEGGQRHLSADDVYRQLLAAGEEIGIATVYRVLAQFEQAGILHRSHFGSTSGGADAGKAVYELDEGEHHDHLVCLDCGRVEEFYDPAIERRQQQIAASKGFTLHEHALSLYAHCNKKTCPHRSL